MKAAACPVVRLCSTPHGIKGIFTRIEIARVSGVPLVLNASRHQRNLHR